MRGTRLPLLVCKVRTMKKLISLMLSVILLAGLAACRDGNGYGDGNGGDGRTELILAADASSPVLGHLINLLIKTAKDTR